MEETFTVYSYFFSHKFVIHGHNVQLPAMQKRKLRWFVYICVCALIYVGSTVDVCARWAGTKKACLDRNNTNTGLYKHFETGCPAHAATGNLEHLRWKLNDFVDTSIEQLELSGHQGGAKCRCTQCLRLKKQ